MKNYINWIIIIIGLSLVGATFYVEKTKLLNEPNVNPYHEVEDPLESDFDALSVWIEELGDMERCAVNGTWDNGSYSYGNWCYKEGTFEYFVRRYDLLPGTEDAELMNLIGDEEIQRELTRLVFEDSYRNTSHWFTSIYIRGLGEPPII